jgi:hypothetical protein
MAGAESLTIIDGSVETPTEVQVTRWAWNAVKKSALEIPRVAVAVAKPVLASTHAMR